MDGLANERMASLLPKDSSTYVKYRGMDMEEIVFDMAWHTVERRSIDWIVQNGKCLDSRFEVRTTIAYDVAITKAKQTGFIHQEVRLPAISIAKEATYPRAVFICKMQSHCTHDGVRTEKLYTCVQY